MCGIAPIAGTAQDQASSNPTLETLLGIAEKSSEKTAIRVSAIRNVTAGIARDETDLEQSITVLGSLLASPNLDVARASTNQLLDSAWFTSEQTTEDVRGSLTIVLGTALTNEEVRIDIKLEIIANVHHIISRNLNQKSSGAVFSEMFHPIGHILETSNSSLLLRLRAVDALTNSVEQGAGDEPIDQMLQAFDNTAMQNLLRTLRMPENDARLRIKILKNMPRISTATARIAAD